jgi:hypothetical protein
MQKYEESAIERLLVKHEDFMKKSLYTSLATILAFCPLAAATNYGASPPSSDSPRANPTPTPTVPQAKPTENTNPTYGGGRPADTPSGIQPRYEYYDPANPYDQPTSTQQDQNRRLDLNNPNDYQIYQQQMQRQMQQSQQGQQKK